MPCRTVKTIALVAALAAWSAPATAETTEDIRTGLQDWLTTTLPHSKSGIAASLDGDVVVEPSGAGYRAILPALRIALGSGAAGAGGAGLAASALFASAYQAICLIMSVAGLLCLAISLGARRARA